MCPREIGRRAFVSGAVGTGVALQSTPAFGSTASGNPAFGTPAFGVPGLDDGHSVRWRYASDAENGIFPTAVAGDSVVTIVRRERDDGDSPQFDVVALSAADRSVRWKRRGEGHPSVPTVVGRTVLVGTRGTLRGYDLRDGTLRWQFEQDNYAARRFLTDDGVVYLSTVEERSDGSTDDYETTVYALDAADGSEVWSQTFDTSRRPAFPNLLDGETLYLGGDGGVVAIAVSDGALRWRADLGGDGYRPAERRGQTVYVWSRDELAALDAETGARRWRRDFGDAEVPYQFTGTVTDATVYVWGERLLALNAKTGTRRWAFDPYESVSATATPDRARGVATALADGTVYAVSGNRVHAVDAESGTERWQFDAGRRLHVYWGGVRDGLVYVMGESTVTVLDADSGEERWTFEPEVETESGEAAVYWTEVTDEALFVGTRDGSLYAVDRPSSFASAPVGTLRRLATTGPGLAALGLVGTGLLVGGYLRTKREGDPDDELGRLGRIGGGPLTETYLQRVRVSDGTALVAETRLTDAADAETRAAFVAGVERWAALDAPGVVAIRDYGTDPVPWFETPYAAGGSLADAWPVAHEARVEAVSAAARALHAAHREGVGHGRLAPSTVFLPEPGDGRNAVVAGWFLGDALGDPEPAYAPPEQASEVEGDGRGGLAESAAPASKVSAIDVYRVGALGYHLLTGVVPDANPRPPSASNPALSDELDETLTTALASDPGDRHASVLAFDDRFRWAALDR